jgi:hypothetical protein
MRVNHVENDDENCSQIVEIMPDQKPLFEDYSKAGPRPHENLKFVQRIGVGQDVFMTIKFRNVSPRYGQCVPYGIPISPRCVGSARFRQNTRF